VADIKGLYLATDFSDHGLQQGAAVGRYIAELVLGIDPSLDLSIFGPKRIIENCPIVDGHSKFLNACSLQKYGG
jgi:FAD-dependent oxidoreductase domain-containing protein 1